jgi:hypothetical protein
MAPGLRLWVIAFSLALSTGAMAATEPALPGEGRVEYFGVTFPLLIGDAKRVSVENKEQAGRGLNVVYAHDLTETTIEMYPASRGKVPDDVNGPVVRREFNNHRQNALYARSAGADIKLGRKFTLVDGHKVPRLICQTLIISHGHMSGPPTDRLSDYYICMGAVNGQFIWTHTMLKHWPDPEPVVRRFLGALVKQVWN